MKKLMGEPVCGGDEPASTERLIFTKGARVEVTSDEEGHKGAWYAATIIDVPPLNEKKRKRETNHPKYVVEYETLLAEDDQTKQLREFVELSFMRPLPPDDDDRQPSFEKNDAVDVFYRDGWWSGVISGVTTDGDGIEFVVSFNNPPDEIHCDASQIRVHRDWVDRKWVTPGKQEIIEPYGGAFFQKRKRGRPRKLPAEILAGWVAVKKKNGVEAVGKDCGTNTAVQSSATEVCVRGMVGVKNDTKVDNGSNEIILRKQDMQLKKHSSTTSELPTQVDSQNAYHGKISEVAEADCASKDFEVAMKEIPSHTFDDRSQLMVFEGVDSPRTVDDSGTGLGETVKHCVEKCGTKDENLVQSLPFVKRSPVWKSIECLEVFQSMPQQPHFSPLEKFKDNRREGLAIGHMVTLASLVETTLNLQFGDPKSIIDCSLETLSDLETHGFQVNPIRGRLNELLLKKDRQRQLLEESKGVEARIAECSLKKTKLCEEIDEIKKKMEELQEKLELATSKATEEDSEIAALQSKMDTVQKDILDVQLCFERRVAAPL